MLRDSALSCYHHRVPKPKSAGSLMSFRRSHCVLVFVCVLAFGLRTVAATPSASADESKTARYFESIHNDPNLLLVFLREMPKGADLHNHLTGSIYAESFIAWAAEAGDCVDP